MVENWSSMKPQSQIKTESATAAQDNGKPGYEELFAQNAQLLEQNHQLKEEIQALRDEVARLKKQKPKPKIGPSKMDGKKRKRGKSRKRKKKAPLKVDETQTVKAADVPF